MPFRAANSALLHFTDGAQSLGANKATTDNQILAWDSGTSTWTPQTLSGVRPLTQSSSATPTLAVTDVRMGLSHASPTITVPDLATAPTDWAVDFQNETAAPQTLTLNRSSTNTFNGGSTSVVLSVPAGARASLWKLSSTTAWVGL